MKKISFIYLIIIILSVCCCKKDPQKAMATLNTTTASDITDTTAVAGGDITNDGNSPITARGVCWSTSSNPTIMDSKTIDGCGTGSYTSLITGLQPDITYNIRAYATNEMGTAYGNLIVFKTKEKLSTETDNKPTGLIITSIEEFLKIPTIESANFDLLFPKVKSSRTLPKSYELLTPEPGNQGGYNNCVGWTIGYGMMSMLFRTIEGREKHFSEWTFSPFYIWNQLNNGINVGIKIEDALELVKTQGCCSIRYMYYSVNLHTQPSENARKFASNYKLSFYRFENPNDIETIKTILSNNYPVAIGIAVDSSFLKNNNKQFEKKTDGKLVWKKYTKEFNEIKDDEIFNHAMLICGYDDNISAFKVLNSWGADWGNMGYFWLDYDFLKTKAFSTGRDDSGNRTKFDPKLVVGVVERPQISTIDAFEISDTYTKSGGIISTDRGHEITSKGICWDTVPEPTISKFKTIDGSGMNQFNSTMTELIPSTTYYVKAYATNSVGTSYGYQTNFTTKEKISLPIVSTSEITSYTSSTATVGGEVTNDGGGTITERGVYWGTNPSIDGTKLKIGKGLGEFTYNLTGLSSNTTYYVKAYAINSQGTAYGSQVSFTTKQNMSLATVSTSDATNITTTSATLGGKVIADGNSSITEKGIVYSTTQNPTTSNNKMAYNSAGIGEFNINVNNLSSNTTYYVKAYAINSQGTAYGSQVNFTTGVIPAAAFSATPTTITAVQSVQFSDQSTNSPNSWSWSFGDGAKSTSRNPSHTYVTPGNYTVSLTAANSFGSNTHTKTNYITVNPAGYPPEPDFSANHTTIITGNSVQFTDQSTNNPTSWNWNFGDGATSTLQNPSHTYNAPGTFTVSLTVTNSFGYKSTTKYNYISVHNPSNSGINFNPNLTYGYVSDIDGNLYRTIQIGTQLWMAENLKTSKYNDGKPIPLVIDINIWKELETPGYCWFNNNTENKDVYGGLYNWYAVNTGKLCPTGWHVPSDSEWYTLRTYLGGHDVAGGKLKEAGTTHWKKPYDGSNAPNGGSNSSGFTALPGHHRNVYNDIIWVNGFSIVFGDYGFWWSSTEKNIKASGFELYFDANFMSDSGEYNKKFGFSVRCVKDDN